MKLIEAVPTNVITGALGVGKTTLIQHLLASKPTNERWAVLVNEFGEVGIDGALLSSSRENESQKVSGIYVREVPGGCMCCASGLPMQIALNQLLAQARPHRLLIEPTGLGHPKEVLATLTAPHYNSVLDLNVTLTLIDPRQLTNERWRNHPTFQQQLQVADCIVATKSDIAEPQDTAQLVSYLHGLGLSNTKLIHAHKGEIDWQILAVKSEKAITLSPKRNSSLSAGLEKQSVFSLKLDTADSASKNKSTQRNGVFKVSNQADGFYSHGWICPDGYRASYQNIIQAIASICVLRLKAVIATDQGIYSFNLHGKELTCIKLTRASDTRIELIAQDETTANSAARELETLLALI